MNEESAMASAAGDSHSQQLPDDILFIMKKHFICRGICLAVRTEIGRKQLTAFVAASGDLNLHFVPGETFDQCIMKLIPWFADSNKRICAMGFDPSGSWLLIAGYDTTVFIVPALAIVDKGSPQDHRWATNDVTAFSGIAGSQNINGHPTAIVWWQSLLDCSHTAVMANDRGEIFFMSLSNGTQVGVTYVRSPVTSLCLCQDNSMDSLFLLITDESQAQWRLLLEQRSTGYSWLAESTSSASDLSSSQGSVDMELNSRAAIARSRLQGLKQLSVEKLAILRQKLADTRTKGVMSVGSGASKRGLSALLRDPDTVSSGGSSCSSNEDAASLNSRRGAAIKEPSFTSSGPRPERLSSRVGDTFLQPQHARGRHLLSGYYSPSSILTVHGTNLEVVPLFVHKLPPLCGNILLTDRFLFVVDSTLSSLSIISSQLSECRLDGDTDFNADSLMETFKFPGEKIVAIFKCTESNYRKEEAKTTATDEDTEEKTKECVKVPLKSSLFQQQVPARDFKTTPIEAPPVDSCVVVTNQGLYTIHLKTPAPDVFLELVLKHQALERAERLALVFGLNLQQLLEHAGDLRLVARDFPNAIALYKLSRCRHLKSVLKFAAGGFSAELLSYVNLLFSTSGSPQQYLTTSEKIHLSNLAVMSNTEQVLRSPVARASLYKNFLKFLRENSSYDEVLAVNVAGQTGLWDVLLHLCIERGLHIQVLEVLAKVFRSGGNDSNLPEGFAAKLAPTRRAVLWMCASEPSLQLALLARPPLARYHLQAVGTHLLDIELDALKRLAALYDPSMPAVRPFLKRHFGHARCASESSSSVLAASESCEMLDASINEEAVFPLELLLQTFLLVLLHITSRQPDALAYDVQWVKRLPTPSRKLNNEEKNVAVPTQNHPLSAGFAHVALVRNGNVYVWGGATLGCLGTGPTMSRFLTPQPTGLFPSLLLEVTSVACGRQHTIALTSNGVFSWGSSYFGQLGVGRTAAQSPTPRLIEALTEEHIVAVAAGQYHSLALTEEGRVFSWGWGVHGQLGHHSVEDEHVPRMVEYLRDHPIVQVSGGHGHSLVLGADGSVYTFGSNVFGQLGNGNCIKSTVPVQVAALPKKIVLIATAYFHNLAVSSSNQLYIWGSSPQALRLQAQAQKKARLLQQQTNNVSSSQSLAESTQSSDSNASSSYLSPSSTSSSSSSSTSAADILLDSSESTPLKRENSDAHTSSAANSSTDATIDRKALKAQLTLDNIPDSSKKSGMAAKVSTDPVMLFDEEFPDVAKLDGSELVAPGLPAIVVSPTVEFKGLSPPPVSTNSDGLVGLSGLGDTSSTSVQWEADESQAHLLPQKVDTGLVTGSISQISCGCHHSALLTSEGVLYVWGRNLDGQVGNGSRKEVPVPTPLSCAPTVSMKTAIGGLSNTLPTAGMERTRLQHISCGCEFTVALEVAGGRVWAWGNNSHGQLGFPPVEDSKPLDGKLVMLKTSKRVIKLPHSMHNACDLPREVSGLPPPALYAFSESQPQLGSNNTAWDAASLPRLNKVEDPPYGTRTLHTALQSLHGLYNVKPLLSKCLELENYQAAARLAALDRHYHMALAYQLRALVRDSGIVPDTITAHADDVAANVNLKNDRNANRKNFATSENSTTKNKQAFVNKRTLEDVKKLHARTVDTADEEQNLATNNVTLDTAVNSNSSAITCSTSVDYNSSASASPVAPIVEHTSNNSSNKGREGEDAQNVSVSSTPDSVTSPATAEDAEIHAFSIQGGREQMSEVGRALGSPDSGLSQPTESPAHHPSVQNRADDSQCNNSEKCSDADRESETKHTVEPEVKLEMPDLIMPPPASPCHEAQDSKTGGSGLVQEASALVEYYVSLMEEDSHVMMSKLLMQGFDFWLQHALPMEHLESLLLRHLPKFCLPLGLLIFCKDTGEGSAPEPALLRQLSTCFCLQVCSLLLGHINQKKPHSEYIEALMKAATTQGLNGCAGGLTAAPEHQLEAVLSGLRGMQTMVPGFFSQPYITLTQEDLQGSVLSDSERLLVFSCGHHYGSETYEQELLPEFENTLRQLSTPLPGTAQLLKGAYTSMGMHLACPRCILSHIQEQVLV